MKHIGGWGGNLIAGRSYGVEELRSREVRGLRSYGADAIA
jgi:hypothetical protein